MNKIEIWALPEGKQKKALPSFSNKSKQKKESLVSNSLELIQIDGKDFGQKLKSFLSEFNYIVDDEVSSEEKFIIDEVELALTVNASGSIALIGKVEAGAQAGIKVKLKRR